MVKKLFKHEFIYYFRTLGLFLPIVLVIGVMTKIFRLINNGSPFTEIPLFSSSVMLVVSCVALLILSGVVGIVRFYKNMYSAEGYLTFTLPVTNTQHIFVKLLVAILCQAICLAVVMTAGAIALSVEDLAAFLHWIYDLTTSFSLEFGIGNTIGFQIELFLMIVASAISNMLLFYACITVGQTAKKNRILLAIGAYFIFYVATQVLSTIAIVFLTALGMSNALDGIIEWIANHFLASMHIYFCGVIVINSALAVGFWIVTHRIMTKKLNLE